MNQRTPIVILGAGPAGLGAALQLARRGPFDVTAVERHTQIGGNAGSFAAGGLQVDYGSHRLHPACSPAILSDIREMLGADLLDRPRHGRMRIRSRWVHFPLKPLDLAAHLPLSFSLGVLRDAAAKLGRKSSGESFEQVLQHGLGRTICRDFYFPYAKKIWGVDPSELDAEQARRRVSAGSLAKMIRKVLGAIPGMKPPGSGRFFYPKRGFGQISEAYHCAALRAGVKVMLGVPVTGIETRDGRAVAAAVSAGDEERLLPARQILSTIPISLLVQCIRPAAPQAVLEAAASLRFRSMILIYLVLETERFTEYDAHYFPAPDVAITRLSEPKNYGLAEAPGTTVLCAELPCSRTDTVWTASDEQLGRIMTDALAAAGLPVKARIRQILTRRLPQAYPIYTRDYRRHFDRITGWIDTIEGLVTFGRQGLFAHDNTHHTLAMAYGLNDCLDEAGGLDRQKWAGYRREFERHVVED